MKRIPAVASAGFFALLPPYASDACSVAQRKLTPAQVKQRAQVDYKRAAVGIDAEVVSPMRFGSDWKSGLTPIAYLRVIKTWKGSVPQSEVPVVYISSCDIGLVAKGEKVRILLTGEGVFRADQNMNGGGVLNMKAYQAEIDRLVGKRRSPALAHFPGELPPPARRANVR